MFAYLKLFCSGNPGSGHPAFQAAVIRERLAVKSKKTFLKHLNSLCSMGWVGYNSKSETYHVRSYKRIITQIESSEKFAAVLTCNDLKSFRAFITGALVGKKVRDTAKYTLMQSKKDRAALVKRDDANPTLDYFGLSNEGIASLLHVAKTTAVERKQEAEAAGYIRTRKKYVWDYQLTEEEARMYIKKCKRYCGNAAMVRKTRGGKYWLCRQLHDEIIPSLRFKKSMAVNKAQRLPLPRNGKWKKAEPN